MSEAAAPGAAWYVDPHDASQWRWWDGSQWTEHTALMRPAGEQTFQEAQAAAVLPGPERTTARWPMPAADAPLVPRGGYSAQAHPSIVKAFEKAMLAKLPVMVCIGIGSLVVMAAGVAALRTSPALFYYGLQMWRRAAHGIRVDSRSEPWAAAFRRRGLVPATGLPGRTASLPLLVGSSGVHAWSAIGEVRGFEATCGELVATFDRDGDAENWKWMLFAAFRIPPGAAERHRRVTVRKKSLTNVRILGGDRKVELESIAVDRALTIHVDKTADDVSVRELFGPQLVAALAERPVAWDQRNEWLLVTLDSPQEPICVFDEFLESAAAVARAYWMDQE